MNCKKVLHAMLLAIVASVSFQEWASAQIPSLGAAESFAVLGATTVTNTGATTITGDVGVSPGTAITGFPPGVVTQGTLHANDSVAVAAHASASTAYNELADTSCGTPLSNPDLGGLTLPPGVYCFATSAQLAGTLTLDAQGDPNAIFVIKTGTTLTTASGSAVNLINGARSNNVFFQVGSSATLGTATVFQGNIIAFTSVTLTTGASIMSGRALAINGAVTLDTNNITVPLPSEAGTPLCAITRIGKAGGRKFIEVTVGDTGSGLFSVVASKLFNATLSVPTFVPGSTSPIVVRATQINKRLRMQLELTVTDVAGNVVVCDPVLTSIGRGSGMPSRQTFTDLPQEEGLIEITNGKPGIRTLIVTVNGHEISVRGLRNNEVRVLNVAAWMIAGYNNTISLQLRGSGGSADIMIHGDHTHGDHTHGDHTH